MYLLNNKEQAVKYLILLFKTYLFFSLNLSQQFFLGKHGQTQQFILKIYLPTESHIYLITSQKHSINFHLPLPQKYGGGDEGGWRHTLKTPLEKHCVCCDQS